MKNELKRWRKQTRVNGIETHTLRLRHLPNENRGVILSLYLINEPEKTSLSIEIDGDTRVVGEYTETMLFDQVAELLRDCLDVIDRSRKE